MQRVTGVVVQLDEIDSEVLALLATNPRMGNVALAGRVGVTDETIATRLRKLMEVGVLAMTVLIDWQQAGYGAYGFVRIRTAGRAPLDTVKSLREVECVHVVAVTVGSCDAVIGLLAADLDELRQVFAKHIRSLDGVSHATMTIVTEVCHHDVRSTTLPLEPWSPTLLTRSAIALDELDIRLVGSLVQNAHESNRWLARHLGVSDGKVRARIQRLEDLGLVRLAAVYDTVTVGEVSSAAFLFIDVVGDDTQVVEALAGHPRISKLDRCLGDTSLVAIATAASENELHQFVSAELRRMPRVVAVEMALVSEAVIHRANLVRLVG